jgi:integrase
MMLSELWERVEQDARVEPITWPAEALHVAKQIARDGRATLPKREGEPDSLYLHRVIRLAERLPSIQLLPADEAAFRQAAEERTKSATQFVELYEHASDAIRRRLRHNLAREVGETRTQSVVGGPTLHQALRDHIAWVKDEYADSNGEVTAWGKVKIKQAEVLLDRHDDLPLAALDHDAIESMVRFWRQRPARKGSDQPIAKKSAEHQIAALKFFLRWLSRSSKYDWKKPDTFDEIRVRIGTRAECVRPQVTPEDIFSLDELVLLNKHATPLERCLLLLGINCGFGRAEIASLTVGEIFLRTAHERRHQEILGFSSTDADSFIKRYRRKTGVYGEFVLFPQTVAAIEWALTRRRRQPGFGDEARLLVNSQGQPYDQPTAGGNPNQQIPNRFAALIRRIQETDEGKDFTRRPFKILRKTAGDLIRRHSDGEVAAVFHSRGQAVRIDDLADAYTTRPFGKVFRAIRSVEKYLVPMFEAAGDKPFGG